MKEPRTQKQLYEFVIKNHEKMKNHEIAKMCRLTLSQVENIKTQLIKNEIIEPKRQKITKILQKYRKAKERYLPEGYVRHSFVIEKDYLDKVHALSFYHQIDIRDVTEDIYKFYFQKNAILIDDALNKYREKNDRSKHKGFNHQYHQECG